LLSSSHPRRTRRYGDQTGNSACRPGLIDDVRIYIGLAKCCGGLNIGCGKVMSSDTFFSGLIDDVHIYNRALRP
jgi:hypothetical protein